ncbi:MAG: hypothetical protein WCV67_20040 [Victivallaceae bacterium]|jgi:hypothetical protein
MMMRLKLENLKISTNEIPRDCRKIDRRLHPYIAAYCHTAAENIAGYRILSKSIDSRSRVPQLIYSLIAEVNGLDAAPADTAETAETETLYSIDSLQLQSGGTPVKHPLIAGTGPAGLMAAYLLAARGCEPVIFDRGFDVTRRKQDIDAFHQSRLLNPDSNYLMGEGGAGTFSDGKLYTRTRDSRIGFILQAFVDAGAPPEILYLKHPHIGSDILPVMVANIRRKIEELGGRFHFGRGVKSLLLKDGVCKGVVMLDGETIHAPAVMLAHGLGGRELSGELMRQGVPHQRKGFQLGCRIEHLQEFIDRNQYHLANRPHCLGAAEYSLVSRPPEKFNVAGVTTFCMCPGGEIVPSTAFAGQLSTNGMSRYARNGKFANSCLIATMPPDTFEHAADAYDFLTGLERHAFALGGGDYTAPAQDAAAFVRQEKRLAAGDTSYSFGLRPARLDELLPEPVSRAVATALVHFEKIFPGFMKSGRIIGIESYISSPVRFDRHPETLESPVRGLYVAGEGAGFAGGITSAAVDGLKVAEQILASR